jgi:hypothetical protein
MASEDRLNTIISAVESRLSTVTGIGKIHNYVRWATREEAFNEFAFTNGAINFWQLTRVNTQERWLTGREVWRVHTIQILGIYGLLDEVASERTFQNLIERVAAKFRTRSAWTLDGQVESIAPYMGELSGVSVMQGAIGGIQVVSVDHRMVNQKLMHGADLRLGVQDTPEYGSD